MPELGEVRREGQQGRGRQRASLMTGSHHAFTCALAVVPIVLVAVLGSTALAQSGATSPPPAAASPVVPDAPIVPIEPIDTMPAGPVNTPPTLNSASLAAPAPTAPADAPAVVAITPPGHEPFYQTWWFWTAVGAAAVTTVAILIATSGSSPPHTDFGNMPAF